MMQNLSNFIREIKNAPLYESSESTFKKRVKTVHNKLVGINEIRDISCPYLLNDLGVRKLDHTSDYLDLSLKKIGVKRIPASLLYDDLNQLPDNLFAEWSELIVMFFGGYELIYKLIIEKKNTLLKIKTGPSNIYLGTCMAAMGDSGCEVFFKNYDKADINYLSSIYRLCVFLIKRTNEEKKYNQYTFSLLDRLQEVHNEERTLILILMNNLNALYFWKKDRDMHNSMLFLKNAEVLCESSQKFSNKLIKDMIFRYLSQIRINTSIILIESNLLEKAENILINNVDFLESINSDYLSEAYSMLSLCYFYSAKYLESLNYASMANKINYRNGNIKAYKAVIKVSIGCHYKIGNLSIAEKYLNLLNNEVFVGEL